MIELPNLRQPAGPLPRIKRSHPIGSRVIAAVEYRGSPTGHPVLRVGTVGNIPGINGMGIAGNNASLLAVPLSTAVTAPLPFSIVVVANKITRTANGNIIGGLGGTGGDQLAGFQFNTAQNNRFVLRCTNGGGATTRQFSANATTSGAPAVLGASINSASSIDVYWNGVQDNGTLSTGASGTPSYDRLALGGIDRGTDAFADTGNDTVLVLYIAGTLTPAEHLSIARNPWQLFDGQTIYVNSAAAGAYTLTAAQGSYTLSGQSANLLLGRRLTAESGTYTLTGQDAALKTGKTLAADQGSYTLTGQNAALLLARYMAAGQGTYTLNGQDATLVTTGGDKVMSAGSGTYTLTGQDVVLSLARKMTAAQGSYALTGQDATLTRGGYVVQADYGTYTLNGREVTLNYSGQPPSAYDIVLARRRMRK